ncbi:MAG TPA: ABC transporter ATP-binding protein [Pseudomonadota bacterium]|jgi:ABC-type multidrug transport system ATPase subunit|nr:ABC transporter ATP-binding protein [Pseudomonadota bacterium]
MTALIETFALSKRFPSHVAVDAIDLRVERGAIYGFLGPNGAGKTTTLRMLLGLTRPNGGRIDVFGHDLATHRAAILRRIGSLIEMPSLYPHLSGRDNLRATQILLDLPRARIDAVLDIVGLRNDAGRATREYSLGMKQRLGLAHALLAEPELLILDEPTNGLDPAGIVAMRELIRELPKRMPLTVLLSSHMLNEVEQIASHVGVIRDGRLLFQGEIAALHRRFAPELRIDCAERERAAAVLAAMGLIVRDGEGALHVPLDAQPAACINRQLVGAGIAVHALHPVRADLTRMFFELTATGAPA